MVAQGFVPGLDGYRQGVGGLIPHHGCAQHLLRASFIALRQRQQQGKDGASQVDDAAVGPVVKVQSMGVQPIEEHGLLQHQVLSGADGAKRARLRQGKGKILFQLFPLKGGTRAGDGQVIQQAPAHPGHDLPRDLSAPDLLQGIQELLRSVQWVSSCFP